MENTNEKNVWFSPVDLAVIIAGLVMLVAFIFLPWTTLPTLRVNMPAASAFSPQPAGALLDGLENTEMLAGHVFLPEYLSVWFNEGEEVITGWGLLTNSYYTSEVSMAPLFLIMSAVGVIVTAAISWAFPGIRLWMRWFTVIFALFGVVHFMFYFGRYDVDLMASVSGIGIWVALAATMVPLFQFFFPRRTPEPEEKEDMLTISEDGVVNLKGASQMRGESLYTKAFRRIGQDYLTLSMLLLLAFLILFSLSAPLIEDALNVSYRTTTNKLFLPIDSGKHILGTDDLGRDHLARLAYAGQITLAIALSAAILSLVIGVSLGIVTGFYGGIVDDIIMWFITTLNSIPQLFLLIIIAAVLSPGPVGLILILGLLGWTGTTRLVRGETLSLREREFVVSARALGASDYRIMFSHILPNLISIVVVTLALDIGALMLAEAALSFLGLGVPEPTPTWGNMLSESQTFFTKAGHLVIAPGLFISLTVLALYVIGDGVRDALDPRTND